MYQFPFFNDVRIIPASLLLTQDKQYYFYNENMEIHNKFMQATSALQETPQTYCHNESISLFMVMA